VHPHPVSHATYQSLVIVENGRIFGFRSVEAV